MRRLGSLRGQLLLGGLSLGLLLVVGYSLLSANYFLRGMDNITLAHMARVADGYARRLEGERSRGLEEVAGYQLSGRWQAMPEAVRQAFDGVPSEPGRLYKGRDDGPSERPTFYFAMHHPTASGSLYVVDAVVPPPEPGMADAGIPPPRDALNSLMTLLGLGVAIAVGLLVALLWWLRHVSRPVQALGHWARGLDARRLQEPTPDFGYPELNELAALLRGGLQSAHDGLAREQRFLAHASHELRTPITVLRHNLELLRRFQQTHDETWSPRHRQVFARMERAGTTMKHLTETLLWLSREEGAAPPDVNVDLAALLEGQVAELEYLLRDKAVAVELDTEFCRVSLPEAPARIVLGNLIRNAFVHTWEGRVVIRQRGAEVQIDNHRLPSTAAEAGETAGESGFGLGLQLTAQLTERLGWPYENLADATGHRVRVVFEARGVRPMGQGGAS
ncbi:Sensor-type histidine kinase PrrB [Halomonas sp. THAF12]|uniref:sensor histidine kinase n=1 Tax=Halomonas sp. THAF12 TaxID=2587849 RepID=UPI0012687DF7|nr:HAMP domain-containing sensor histidine kinase [Halomonas sp. THAF12]QFT85484.1 Sensor-type histidine kinase PrrB [Halomonas sp. THAF12]